MGLCLTSCWDGRFGTLHNTAWGTASLVQRAWRRQQFFLPQGSLHDNPQLGSDMCRVLLCWASPFIWLWRNLRVCPGFLDSSACPLGLGVRGSTCHSRPVTSCFCKWLGFSISSTSPLNASCLHYQFSFFLPLLDPGSSSAFRI